MALKLKAKGIERVRPLKGGFHEWREKGYPLKDYQQDVEWHRAFAKT